MRLLGSWGSAPPPLQPGCCFASGRGGDRGRYACICMWVGGTASLVTKGGVPLVMPAFRKPGTFPGKLISELSWQCVFASSALPSPTHTFPAEDAGMVAYLGSQGLSYRHREAWLEVSGD